MPHPDFQKDVQWVGPIQGSGTNTGFNAGGITLINPSIQYSYRNIMLRISAISGANGEFVFTFYDSVSLLNVVGTRRVQVRAGQVAAIIVPVLGPAVGVTLTGSGAGGLLSWQLFPTNLDPGVYPNDITAPLRYSWSVNIGAGVTQTFQLPPYAGGVALAYNFSNQPGVYVTYGENILGVSAVVYHVRTGAIGNTGFDSFYVGPTFNIFSIQNTGAGAGDYFASLVAAPRARELY